MKRAAYLVIVSVVISMSISIGIAFAQDKVLDNKIESVTIDKDKNGNEYVRFIVEEARELSGIKYNTSVAVMAFGETVQAAKSYREGQSLKAVVSSREYQGRVSYTILAFVN
jgi:hypothetical protein